MAALKFVITIDHLDDEELGFFGWYVTAENDEFKLYRREYDGEQQVVQNASPRYFVLDDPNDAQQLCRGTIITGPAPLERDH